MQPLDTDNCETSSITLAVKFAELKFRAQTTDVLTITFTDYEWDSDLFTMTLQLLPPFIAGNKWTRVRVTLEQYEWQHGSRKLVEEIPWTTVSHEARLVKMARLIERFVSRPFVKEETHATT